MFKNTCNCHCCLRNERSNHKSEAQVLITRESIRTANYRVMQFARGETPAPQKQSIEVLRKVRDIESSARFAMKSLGIKVR